jgi:hypothetical protein
LFVSSYALIWVEYAPRSWLFPEHTSHWLAEYVEYKPGSSWAAVIAGALLVTAISPIWEEILYRALLLPKAVSRWGAAPGLLLLSTISAVLHHAMLGPFVFAAVLGILFLSTRSIAVPIIVHSVYNTLAFLTAGFDPWVHPLEGGYLRRMYRRDRRPGLALEWPVLFHAKYLRHVWRSHRGILSLWLRFNKVRKEIKANPNRFAYTDLALTPVQETDDECLALFTVTDAAKAALKKTGGTQPRPATAA